MKEKRCNTCKERANVKLTWMTILSIYVLATSVYGSIILFHKISDFISSLF